MLRNIERIRDHVHTYVFDTLCEGVGEEALCSIHSINILCSLQLEKSIKVERSCIANSEWENKLEMKTNKSVCFFLSSLFSFFGGILELYSFFFFCYIQLYVAGDP